MLTSVIRWILVIPLGVVALALIAFPIHWVVSFTFGGWGHDPIITVGDRETLGTIERVAQSFFGPMLFVAVGALTAPFKRLIVGIVLAVLATAIFVGLQVWLRSQPDVEIKFHPVQWLFVPAGMACGIWYVYVKQKQSASSVA